jgi:hypothetical protein
MYVTNWPVYATANLESNLPCILARDPNAGTFNTQIPSSSIVYDGDTWHYTDYGAGIYYDQCQYYAGIHGASLITPQTIGLNIKGDATYWVSSTHQCSTYEYFTSSGKMGYENTNPARSTARSCLIGYIGGCLSSKDLPAVHLTSVWMPSLTATGSKTYGVSGVTAYNNVGSMSWKQCLNYASKYGAMLFPSATTQWGWSTHREFSYAAGIPSGSAMYVTDGNYNAKDISSSAPCILARDNDAGWLSSRLPSSSIFFDGDFWNYQDFGSSVFYDQCQNYAGLYGGSIITPQTIGLTGDNYWVASINQQANTYQYFTNSGTFMGVEDLSADLRSSARSCMIGYIGGCANEASTGVGGRGASIRGTFPLSAGQSLSFLIGEQPPLVPGKYPGGGGATFVGLGANFSAATPLLVAGGGGGSSSNCISTIPLDYTSLTFNFTGAAQTWVVPAGVTSITLDMCGAQGGMSLNSCSSVGRDIPGGQGANMIFTTPVTPGMVLAVIVGQMPTATTCLGSGGGASWILISNSLLAVAGAGGGSYASSTQGVAFGSSASLTKLSTPPSCTLGFNPSSQAASGYGGSSFSGGGGAGYFSGGTSNWGYGGVSKPSFAGGGAFGGGGGQVSGGSGAGGGYTGSLLLIILLVLIIFLYSYHYYYYYYYYYFFRWKRICQLWLQWGGRWQFYHRHITSSNCNLHWTWQSDNFLSENHTLTNRRPGKYSRCRSFSWC